MLRGKTIKLDPTPTQQAQLAAHVGASRFAYNTVLAHVKEAHRRGEKIGLSGYELRKWWNENKNRLAPWWKQNSKEAYSNAILNLGKALSNFFKGLKKKKHVGFPRFKKRGVKDSYTITAGAFGVVDSCGILLPKIGRIHTLENLAEIDPNSVKSITIRRKADGWYASLALNLADPQPRQKTGKTVGIDLGISHLAVLSDGTAFPKPDKMKKLESKRRRYTRAVSRKKKGSSNREKAKTKLARLDKKIADARKDSHHKIAAYVAQNYDEVVLEDLDVSSMIRNHRLSKSISNAAWSTLRSFIEYKCLEQGVQVTIADKWFPSSKTCSRCGQVKSKLGLSERVYSCEVCGLVIDRDLNAAKNLDFLNPSVAESTSETLNACGRVVSPCADSGMGRARVKQESSLLDVSSARSSF